MKYRTVMFPVKDRGTQGAYNLSEGWEWLTQKGFGLSSYAVPLTW
jgi:hypothetical protein